MLVKTDFCKGTKTAKITFQCPLCRSCYSRVNGNNTIDLIEVARQLQDIENNYINNYHGDAIMTLSKVMPVGYPENEWLVMELSETGNKWCSNRDWRDYLARVIGVTLMRIAEKSKDNCVISVEYSKKHRFNVVGTSETTGYIVEQIVPCV